MFHLLEMLNTTKIPNEKYFLALLIIKLDS